MIDHVSVGVRDLERAARFYETALAPLGLSRLVTRPATVGFGKSYPEFWINLRAEMAQVGPTLFVRTGGQFTRLKDGEMAVSQEPLPEMPPDLKKILEEGA